MSDAASSKHNCKPPRRFKSVENGLSLDAIGEDQVHVGPPRRHKSVDELDAALHWGDDDDDDDDDDDYDDDYDDLEDFDKYAGHEDIDEAAQGPVQVSPRLSRMSSFAEDGDFSYLDLSYLMEECSIVESVTSGRRLSNTMSIDSFSSVGSNMTAAQREHPGRFVTPMNSLTPHDTEEPDAPQMHHERITIEPQRFLTADISFRPPLLKRGLSKGNSKSSTQDKHSQETKWDRWFSDDDNKASLKPRQNPADFFSHPPSPPSLGTTKAIVHVPLKDACLPAPPPVAFGLKRKSSIRRLQVEK